MTSTIKPLFTWRSAIMESTLSASTKLVALALATYMSDRGTSAFPGPTRLARDTSLHLSTVKERLAELERTGWLTCVARGGVAGEQRRANEYAAAVPDPSPTAPVATGDPSSVATGTRRRGRPVPVAHGDPNTPYNSPLVREREGAPAPGTRIPIPFDVTEKMLAWAARNTPRVDVDQATEAFVDHYKAAAGDRAIRADWPATWRQWMRREATGAFR